MTSTTDTLSTRRLHRHDRGRVAVFELDHPDRSMNVIDEAVFEELRAAVADVSADPAIDAVVLASAKAGSFGAGADVAWIPQLVARPDAEEFLRGVHELMRQIVDSPKPWVSAVEGPALGGAFELVLATHGIVAAESARLALPEVTLGLIPGGGGTQLLRRWLRDDVAGPLLLEGSAIDAPRALELGLAARVVPEAHLLDEAVALANALTDGSAARTGTDALGGPLPDTVARTDAQRAIVRVLEAGSRGGIRQGLEQERTEFLALAASDEASARIHLFLAQEEVKRRSRRGGAAADVSELGVVGGGQMGAGIASTAVTRGRIRAIVRDVSAEQLGRAAGYRDRVLARLEPSVAAEGLARWSETDGWSGFERVDAVIEAVFELPELKRDVLAQAAGAVSPTTLLATNTSAIPIATLAGAVSHPDRFLGMHFFSPVERMPLVEIVPHTQTSADTVDRALRLASRLGKVGIVVADRPGFFTSRVYARWLIEGIRLLLDGVAPDDVERAAKSAGFPVGPLQAFDEATLDLVLKASITQVAQPVMADRLDVVAVQEAITLLLSAGIEGRRQGEGFYTYEDGRRRGLNPRVGALLRNSPTSLGAADVAERLVLAFASESWLCWDDGTLCHPDDGDVASVLGIGFPAALGGPFHWADRRGALSILESAKHYGTKAFPVGELLPSAAAGSFGGRTRRLLPGG